MVRPMFRKLRVATVVALVMAAQGCGRKPEDRVETNAVHALLTSSLAHDAKTFEAVLDRAAVRADLRRQLMQVAEANGLAVEGGPSDAALDRMITPHAFQLVEAASGAPLHAPPSKAQTAALIKPAGKDRVCVHDQSDRQACLLTFAKAKDGWRLVGMAPGGFVIPVAPAPAKS